MRVRVMVGVAVDLRAPAEDSRADQGDPEAAGERLRGRSARASTLTPGARSQPHEVGCVCSAVRLPVERASCEHNRHRSTV